MDRIAHYRRRFAHERDAFARTLAALETVPEAARDSADYRKAVDLLAHLAVARAVWLERLGVGAPAGRVLFPEGTPLADVVARWEAATSAWDAYLAGLADADLDRVVEYAALDGQRFRNTLDDILTQLDGHAPYHRGQVAMLIKRAGGTPTNTDFILWCREPITPP